MRIAGENVTGHEDQKAGIGTLLGRLVEDGKAYAHAEIGYVRALAGERLRAAKSGLVFLIAGLVLLHGALIALFVGLVLSLATLIGPFWSMLVVVLVAGIAGGILAKVGLSHFQRAKAGPDSSNGEVTEP